MLNRLTEVRRLLGCRSFFQLPPVINEPAQHYEPGSASRAGLVAALTEVGNSCPEIPCIVNGKSVFTGDIIEQLCPHDQSKVLCRFHQADEKTLSAAVDAAETAKHDWENLSQASRLAIFRKAADLLSSPRWRYKLMAATMYGQGKNAWQAEIDAALETIDFLRFNAQYAHDLSAKWQPEHHDKGVWNRLELRPLEGFVLAISPFNFTAIGANLHTAPAIMGNTTVWKPSSTALLASYYVYELLAEAGLPAGVTNFVPASGALAGQHLVKHPKLGGLHFTGSTATFNTIWRDIGSNLERYRSYPRIVGETGGKNFAIVHESANYENALYNIVRGAFEYQGQKCSATSRVYVPRQLWETRMKKDMADLCKTIKVGPPTDFDSFMCAVIDKTSFRKIRGYIEHARADSNCRIVAGGDLPTDQQIETGGLYIPPTIVEASNPCAKTMVEEIFGPVLTVHPYDDWEALLPVVDTTTSYALTGSIFATDRYVIEQASRALRHSAGNFYINDKSTGAVVGQQPFGGARKSGTNDKAGHAMNLLRWTSARSIKENSLPLSTLHYPSNQL